MMDIFPILMVLLYFATFCDGSDLTCNKYESVKGFGKLIWNIRLRSSYLQFHPTTLKQCAIECLVRRGRCKSINFSRQMSFCELNYKNSSDGQTAEKCTSFDYSDINTWSTDLIGKCKHKVCKKKERCSTATGKCLLSDCGPVNFSIPKNSILQNHGHHEIGTAIDFLCKNGYRMYHKDTLESMYVAIIMCMASGDWDKVEFVCLACDKKTLRIQSLVELVENYSSLVNEEYALKCKSGYMPYINGTTKAESVTVACNVQTHKWERPDFVCKKCDPISFEIPKNSVLQNYSEHEVGNSVNFTCKPGYLMYNKHTKERMYDGTMKCNASGQWGDVEFDCLKCKPFKNPKNSVIQSYNDTEVGTFLNITCKDGYMMYNKSTLEQMYYKTMTCNASGQWEDVEFVCLECKPFKTPKNSVIQSYNDTEVGTFLNITCKDGYMMYNKSTLEQMYYKTMTCNASGQWEDVEFACLACDRNELLDAVDSFAEVLYGNWSLVEEKYIAQCVTGYTAYIKGKLILDDIIVTCNNDTNTWEGTDFVCKGCDRNKLKVDTFAELVKQNLSSNSADNYLFRCKSGYTAYINGTPISDVVNVTCNKETHEWEGHEFFCKNAKTMSKDFCQNGYNYNKFLDMCWKYHHEKLPHKEAQKVCMAEKAHLVVLMAKHMQSTSYKEFLNVSEAVFIDGIAKRGKLRGWANQILNYPIGQLQNDLCAMLDKKGLTLQDCSSEREFVCQFELCPETAGYTYNVTTDICYNYNAPSQYSKNLCDKITIPYSPTILQINTEYQKNIYGNLQAYTNEHHKDEQMTTYFLSTSKANYMDAQKTCESKGMHLAVLDTVGQKMTAAEIMGAEVKSVLIALKLSVLKTYEYRFTDGTIPTLDSYSPKKETDKKQCIILNRFDKYSSANCSELHRFLCTGLDNKNEITVTAFQTLVNFETALKMCKDGKQILAKIDDSKTMSLVKEKTKKKSGSYYIGLKLHHKNYIYHWVAEGYDNKYINGSSEDFEQGYNNDTRDEYHYCLFNATNMKFELTDLKTPSPYLCGTNSLFAWYNGEDLQGYLYAVKLNTSEITAVDKGSVLPYVCEIDTNSRIIDLSLNRKKPAFSDNIIIST